MLLEGGGKKNVAIHIHIHIHTHPTTSTNEICPRKARFGLPWEREQQLRSVTNPSTRTGQALGKTAPLVAYGL